MAKNQVKPFIPTLHEIRTAEPARLRPLAVAEGFDAVSAHLQQLTERLASLEGGVQTIEQKVAASGTSTSTTTNSAAPASTPAVNKPAPVATPPSFSVITDGENTQAAMVVGTGASITIDPTNPGEIEASQIWTTPVDPTPPSDAGEVLVTEYQGSPASLVAVFRQFGINGIDCETSPGIPLLLTNTGYLKRVDCDEFDSPLVKGSADVVFDCGVVSG